MPVVWDADGEGEKTDINKLQQFSQKGSLWRIRRDWAL